MIAEVLRDVLTGPSTGNLTRRIERELAARGLSADAKGAGRQESERCGRCGGLRDERDHESNSDRVCRCGGREGRLLSYLDSVDPSRRMVLGRAEDGRDWPTSLGAWIVTLSDEEAYDGLRGIFPESPARQEVDSPDPVEDTDVARASADEAAPSLPTKAVLGSVAVAAALGLALGAVLLSLRDFAGYVSTTPAGEPVLYPGPLGPLRRLADAAPFRILYDFYPIVVVAAVLCLALFFIAKVRARHLARWRSSRLRLKKRWELHRVPERPGSPAPLTRREALWGILAWPLGYLLAGWLFAALEGLLGLAASLQMAPEIGPLVADPGLASLYAATALSAFVLCRRRSMRSAEARMLAGKIRH